MCQSWAGFIRGNPRLFACIPRQTLPQAAEGALPKTPGGAARSLGYEAFAGLSLLVRGLLLGNRDILGLADLLDIAALVSFTAAAQPVAAGTPANTDSPFGALLADVSDGASGTGEAEAAGPNAGILALLLNAPLLANNGTGVQTLPPQQAGSTAVADEAPTTTAQTDQLTSPQAAGQTQVPSKKTGGSPQQAAQPAVANAVPSFVPPGATASGEADDDDDSPAANTAAAASASIIIMSPPSQSAPQDPAAPSPQAGASGGNTLAGTQPAPTDTQPQTQPQLPQTAAPQATVPDSTVPANPPGTPVTTTAPPQTAAPQVTVPDSTVPANPPGTPVTTTAPPQTAAPQATVPANTVPANPPGTPLTTAAQQTACNDNTVPAATLAQPAAADTTAQAAAVAADALPAEEAPRTAVKTDDEDPKQQNTAKKDAPSAAGTQTATAAPPQNIVAAFLLAQMEPYQAAPANDTKDTAAVAPQKPATTGPAAVKADDAKPADKQAGASVNDPASVNPSQGTPPDTTQVNAPQPAATQAPSAQATAQAAAQTVPQPVHPGALQTGNQSAVSANTSNLATGLVVTPRHDDGGTGIDKLGLAIATKSADGIRQFDIRLDPPDLGRVQVSLTVDDSGRAQAHLVVDKPQTLELLQNDAGNLNRALTDAGLNLPNNGLNFSLREQYRQNDGGVAQGRSRALSVKAVVQSDASQIHAALGSYAPNSVRLDIRV